MKPILNLTRRPLTFEVPAIMGVLNTTPDSFSDGGRHHTVEAALAHALSMVAAGAEIIDVGGESTRPGAAVVEAEEEIARVVPIIEALRGRDEDILISCDTTKAAVAEAALIAGADIINDVSGLERDPALGACVARYGAGLVLMHMRGTPATMMSSDNTRYDDVVEAVCAYLARRVEVAVSVGIAADRIVVDPGIGFAKVLGGNLKLIRYGATLGLLGCPVLIGLSRKRFIGELTGVTDAAQRDAGTIGGVVAAALFGAHILRVHNVKACKDALSVATAIAGA